MGLELKRLSPFKLVKVVEIMLWGHSFTFSVPSWRDSRVVKGLSTDLGVDPAHFSLGGLGQVFLTAGS